MPDLNCHNLNIYVIFNWFVLTASILCNSYCPFLLFVVILSFCMSIGMECMFLTTSPNK